MHVVIVTHRGGPLLHRCVDSVLAQDPVPDTVRVVVSHEVDHPMPDGVIPTWLGANPGFAVAANHGLRAVDQGPILLLNDDTRLRPGVLAQLSLAHATHGPGIYQPRIVLADGSGRVDNLGHHLFPDGFNLARGRGGTASEARGIVGAFSGAAVCLSPEVLAQAGLFDEDLEAFGEDVDLSLRARRLGLPLRYVPQAVVEHELGATYGRVSARKLYLVERNRLLAAVRSMPASALATMPLWSALRLGALALAATRGRGIGAGVGPLGLASVLAGGAAGLAGAPRAWRKRREDQGQWTVSEAEMWGHLLASRVRFADIIARAEPPGGAA